MLTKIGIVDDHIITTVGVKDTLIKNPDFKIEFISYSARQCLSELTEHSIDILIMDVILPDMDGFELINQIHYNQFKCKNIIFSSLNSDAFLYRCFKAKVNAILCKDATEVELHNSIHAVNDNCFYIQPKYSEPLRQCILVSGNSTVLSKRETEVLACIANGLSNREISNKLFISERTVKSHVSNIILKLDVVDRTQAAVYAIKSGLISEIL